MIIVMYLKNEKIINANIFNAIFEKYALGPLHTRRFFLETAPLCFFNTFEMVLYLNGYLLSKI